MKSFRTPLRSFSTTTVDETAHRLLTEYLQSTIKPRNMSVMEVSMRVQVFCSMYADDLPTESGASPALITELEEKKTLS
jgi:hypothetical protein